jgi:hypothetical protein
VTDKKKPTEKKPRKPKKPGPRVSPMVRMMIAKAIEELEAAEPSLFMTADRAKGKAKRINPTDTQARLLRYVQQHQPIPFRRTLAMDWRFLGGLLTRHRVEWKDGDLVVCE